MAIPAFATHMCIGSPWAWSIMGDIVTKEIGFVAPVAADWTLAQSCLPLSLVFVFLGGTAAALGPWQRWVLPVLAVIISYTACTVELAIEPRC